MIPEVISRGAINKTLRCAVEQGGELWPIPGGQSLNETPGQANVETVELFLITESYPGADQPGQFQFNWRLVPGSPIDQILIDAGRDKTPITLDFRNPGAVVEAINVTQTSSFNVAVKNEGDDARKGLSRITAGEGNVAWFDDDDIKNGNLRIGHVLERGVDDELIVVAAIFCDDIDGSNPQVFTKGRDVALPVAAKQGGAFKVTEPNTRYRVSGTGVSFANDNSGIVPIGQLTMTVDTEPVYELIHSSLVNAAYIY